MTDTNADEIIAAQTGIRLAPVLIVVSNGHATATAKVTIRAGTSTVRSRAVIVECGPTGGGAVIGNGRDPIFIGNASEAIQAISADTADIEVDVTAYAIGNMG